MTASNEPRVSDEDREALATQLVMHFNPEQFDPDHIAEVERRGWKMAPPVDKSTLVSFTDEDGCQSLRALTFGEIADFLVSHGWGPTAGLRDERDQLARALLATLYDLHPVGGSTSRTGIGGAAMTTFCDIANPINVAAEELRDKVEGVLRYQARRMEREGYSLDSVELRECGIEVTEDEG